MNTNQVMEQATKKSQHILWIIAILAVFAAVIILGGKIFYGVIVPHVQAVSHLGVLIVLGFAFIAGLAAFFAPCPFAVFPAYIAYYLNVESDASHEDNIHWLHALKIGSIVSLGIFSFYGILGAVTSVFGTIVASYTNYLKLAIIPFFFILGFLLISGKSLGAQKLDELTSVVAQRAKGGKHFWNMYLYGIVYGIAAAACHLPILLALSFYPVLSGQFLPGFVAFISYAVGASVLLIFFTILAGYGKRFLSHNLGLYGERVKKVGGVVLILTGTYLASVYIISVM